MQGKLILGILQLIANLITERGVMVCFAPSPALGSNFCRWLLAWCILQLLVWWSQEGHRKRDYGRATTVSWPWFSKCSHCTVHIHQFPVNFWNATSANILIRLTSEGTIWFRLDTTQKLRRFSLVHQTSHTSLSERLQETNSPVSSEQRLWFLQHMNWTQVCRDLQPSEIKVAKWQIPLLSVETGCPSYFGVIFTSQSAGAFLCLCWVPPGTPASWDVHVVLTGASTLDMDVRKIKCLICEWSCVWEHG